MHALLHDHGLQTALRAGLAILALVALVVFLLRAWGILEPLLVSAVLATSLWPWVSRISDVPLGPRHWHLPRIAVAALIYGVTILLAAAIVWLVLASTLPYVDQLIFQYPEQLGFLNEYLDPFRSGDVITGASLVAEDVARESATSNGEGNGGGGGEGDDVAEDEPEGVQIASLALALFGGLVTLILVLVFTFFLLIEGHRVTNAAIYLLPRDTRLRARVVGIEIRDRISRWVLAQVIYASLSGLIVGAFAWALQLPSPHLFGILGAFLAALPGIGPPIALIPAFAVSLGLEPWQPVAVVLFGIVYYGFDALFLSPKILGRMMKLSTFVTLVALLLGLTLMGVWGALIGAPLAAAAQTIIRDQFFANGRSAE